MWTLPLDASGKYLARGPNQPHGDLAECRADREPPLLKAASALTAEAFRSALRRGWDPAASRFACRGARNLHRVSQPPLNSSIPDLNTSWTETVLEDL